MNAKNITRVLLLTVVAVAIGSWAYKEFGPKPTAAEVSRPDGVTLISFHGNKRCPTCIKISDLAKTTLDQEFANEIKAGEVHWDQVNYEAPENAHYVKRYQLVSSTVVVTQWKNGKEVGFKPLDGVWDHVGDEPVFRTYISKNVRGMLAQP